MKFKLLNLVIFFSFTILAMECPKQLSIESSQPTTDIKSNVLDRIIKISELINNSELDINFKFPDGTTCLMLAVSNNMLDIAKALLDNKADVNQIDNLDYTSLMLAVENNNKEMVELLLSYNANIFALNKNLDTALDIAQKYNLIEIINILNQKALAFSEKFKILEKSDNSQNIKTAQIETTVIQDFSQDFLFENQEIENILFRVFKKRKNRRKCKYCHRVFQNPSGLKRHMSVHTGQKPFSCDLCGRNFSQKASVKRHKNIIHKHWDQGNIFYWQLTCK